MLNVQVRRACLMLLVLVAGCPADDEDKADGSSSQAGGNGDKGGSIADQAGLDEEKSASKLTTSEAEDLCMAGNAKISRTLTCTSEAVRQTEDSGACEERRDACASQDEELDDCATAADDLAACDGITVGDISECFDDIVAYMKSLSCDKPGVTGNSPACIEELYAACPGLFSDGEGEGETGSDSSHEQSGSDPDDGPSESSSGGSDGDDSVSSLDLPQCEGVETGCLQAYATFCDCCPGSEGCLESEDPCAIASGLQTECEADTECEPACANWIIDDCTELQASGPDSCIF